MSDLVKLEEKFLAHHLESADLSGILLLSEENLTITTLSDLCENLEVSLAKTNTTLSQVRTLSPSVFVPKRIISLCWRNRRSRIFCLEMAETILTSTNVCQEIKVVVEKIYISLVMQVELGQQNLQSCVTFANRLTFGFCSISNSSAVNPLCVLYFLMVGAE